VDKCSEPAPEPDIKVTHRHVSFGQLRTEVLFDPAKQEATELFAVYRRAALIGVSVFEIDFE